MRIKARFARLRGGPYDGGLFQVGFHTNESVIRGFEVYRWEKGFLRGNIYRPYKAQYVGPREQPDEP